MRISKRMEVLWDRIQVLENHAKRNNVRVIGLKETIGTFELRWEDADRGAWSL